MSYPAILAPLFVEVALTFVLLYWTGFARRNDLVSRTVHPRDIALGQLAWPARTQQLANSYLNQFQLPVLFYVLTILALITKHADIFFVVMAWLFVLLRVWHAYIHVNNNRVMLRGSIFGLGGVVLTIMWIIFAVRILLGLP